MLKNNVKEMKAKKADEVRKNDVKLYRLMIEFALAVVAFYLTVMAKNSNQIDLHIKVMPVVLVVTGILFALSAAFYGIGRNKNENNDYKIITRGGIFGNFAALFFGCLHYYFFLDAPLLIVTLIAVTVLYFIYNIFGGSMFEYSFITVACFTLLGITGVDTSIIPSVARAAVYGSKFAALILPVAAVIYAFIRYAKKSGEKVMLVPIIISSVLTLAGAVLNFVYPTAVIFAVFGLVGCYLIAVIVHTVRNM